MIALTAGRAVGTYTATVDGHRIDLTQADDGQWHAVLHQAPHRDLVRPAHDRGVVERRLQAWSAEEIAGVAP